MDTIGNQVQRVVKELFDVDEDVELTRPDPKFGDFATNVALKLAKKLGKNPMEIALALAAKLQTDIAIVDKASVAGPGFINLQLSDAFLLQQLPELTKVPKSLSGKVVVAEYSDPNPFKVLHAGHLYTSIVGDAIANLLQAGGAKVHRVNYGGDVGLHVGKTMWAIVEHLGGEHPEALTKIPLDQHAPWLSQRYVEGNNAYEDKPTAKAEIIALNKRVYQLHAEGDRTSPFAQIYWTTRQWSYAYFDQFYARIGTTFEKYYPESQVAESGIKMVKEQLAKGVFAESDGAIVFKGEDYGLHTRVFINSQGLPTYEAKEIGVLLAKWNDYHFDKSVVITANEIEQYMHVVLKAVEQFEPDLVQRTTHLTHGMVKLAGGQKMSSRKGNILTAVDVLDAAASANERKDEQVTQGAVKYAFLKVRTGGDVIYDPKESVSLEGNSGPYLQYAHARACAILRKASTANSEQPTIDSLDAGERTLVLKLTEYSEVVAKAIIELMPHLICTYLYELAQEFNRFYEHNRVIGEPREAERLQLIVAYTDVLKNGLQLLGIHAPEQM